MKSILVLLVIALITVNGQTLCDKYKGTGNGHALVETVVNATIGAVVDPKNGIAGFFNGQLGGTDFTAAANAGLLNNLRAGLVSFFGDKFALNCTDGSITAYAGADMNTTHAGLKIDFKAFFTFNNLLLNVLTGASVQKADVGAVAMLLDSLRPSICNQVADCTSLCNKLVVPGLGTTNGTVAFVVNATVVAALGDVTLKPYFTGVTGGRVDFTAAANAGAFGNLFSHLVSYFGGALGCSDGTIAPYTGLTLKEAHTGMMVTQKAFDTFNSALMGVLKPFISQGEFDFVYGFLNSTHDDVCTAPDCGTASTTTTATTATTATTTTKATSATTATTATTSATSATSGTSTTTKATTSSTSATTSATPAPQTSTTGFGLVLAPVFAMFTVFLF
jgi:hypothetical protein